MIMKTDSEIIILYKRSCTLPGYINKNKHLEPEHLNLKTTQPQNTDSLIRHNHESEPCPPAVRTLISIT